MQPARILTLAIVIALALGVGGVSAHSSITSSQPSDGAVVSGSPGAITISFDRPMRIVSVSLVDASGTEYAVRPKAGRSASQTLTVEPPALPAGDYTLEWRGLSEDGHTLSEGIGFTVRAD
jgi:methionine-rich copper-binding protein CopC